MSIPTEIQGRFKKFGKIIYMSTLIAPLALGAQRAFIAMIDQPASADPATDYTVFSVVMGPFVPYVKQLIDSSATMPAKAKQVCDTFLRNTIATDFGLQVGSSFNQVGAALITAMNATGQTVAPSGTGGSNATGFAMYFATNYGLELPQNASPSIPDQWIDDEVRDI